MANTSNRTGSSNSGRRVPASVVAKCAGVSPSRRGKWASRLPPLVRCGPFFTAHDAVETAIVAALAAANQKIAPEAWLAVRQDVRKLALAGVEDIWVLMSATGLSHQVANGAAAAAEIAASTGEAFHIVDVARQVRLARELYEAEAAKLRARGGGGAAAAGHGSPP